VEKAATKKELTHRRIVETAARSLRRGGFAGVGVADVMAEAGLTHGGFYAHFESREALLAEAIAQAGEDSAASLTQRVDKLRARGASPLRALVEGYLSEAHLVGSERGCPVASFLAEVPRQPPDLQDAALLRVQSLIDTVRKALPDPRAKDQATVIAATLVGALQLARALGANAKGKAVLTAARRSLLAAHDSV
jgi:TetR/AcrR family transcriptional regulator, transcriptional repressor for nem operon